ncbi:MAG: phosphoribosyltransferase [Alphaproteobacteria bacterium]|nr:phosphoribosyltransferase [Alphaproteobacteria bacterium]MBV9584678.1 phosphoribosyltransferase [Alphaproteobacteria bacterium]MBV9964924.1 phosphoribosyltransferase [Alphaproteobacteria bacterium]
MPFFEPLFDHRRDAGRRLAAALAGYRQSRPIVLALPRGGVPVGFEVAKALAAPLDVLLVRKIGAPGHEELGLGAIVDGHDPQLVLNEDVVRAVAPPPGYIEAETERQLAEIERRRQHYVGDRPLVLLTDRVVIVIDDGIATGATVKAALRGVRRHRPARLVLAVPVAPVESLNELTAECDDVVCLATPEPFYAVGPHYRDFRQTSDDEVVRLLADARQRALPLDPEP